MVCEKALFNRLFYVSSMITYITTITITIRNQKIKPNQESNQRQLMPAIFEPHPTSLGNFGGIYFPSKFSLGNWGSSNSKRNRDCQSTTCSKSHRYPIRLESRVSTSGARTGLWFRPPKKNCRICSEPTGSVDIN